MKTTLKTPQATFEFGELLGKYLIAGDVVALIGVGVPEEYCITSPTYTIVNEYQGRIPLYHFDLYRLEGNSDLENLGYEEYFEGKGVTVIEWAEKITHLLPENRMEVRISHLGNDVREFEIIGFGDHYGKIVDDVVHFLPR
ncbi:MAG: tRNA (adenosine(37)-N6)-threonylcarbamoyltransferase complex ATPase subunit type 1 TsaE [Desulfobacterales bacterium]|nr:tRNA (adenosine(37)-N6)-threonylcarbamoyltransferase complex ATPase subunit type 1 TsaE [Desulfobacterales bacterium]